MKTSSEQVGKKQKKLFFLIVLGCIGCALFCISFMGDSEEKENKTHPQEKTTFHTISQEVDPKTVRLSALENMHDALQTQVSSLEQSVAALRCEEEETSAKQQELIDETRGLKQQIFSLREDLQDKGQAQQKNAPKNLQVWQEAGTGNGKHVAFEIPAGTVVKAVLVSGADCSVAVQKPTGPNMVLLRPLDNGNLPRNVRVPLKGSVIIGNAIGDISSERVYVRTERMSLVERNGSFIETELSGYVSGEDGREGMRGVVVDRSGQIVTRAAFAAFLQGAAQGVEAMLQTNTFAKMAESYPGLKALPYGPVQGGTTALNKMTDYYIKRAEQLQPAIQIAAGRVVDIVFTKTVKIGEKDLKKKLELERALQRNLHD